MDKHILIDGDVIAYRLSFKCKDMTDEQEVLLEVRDFFSNLYNYIDPFNLYEKHVYLTGKGNFRYDIAKVSIYKGNRKDTPKPTWLSFVRQVILDQYRAILSNGFEADDLIAMAANKHGYNSVVIVSTDKDFNQLPVTIYNLTKGEFTTISKVDAIRNFYKQVLMGDRVDNIFGIYGIGPVKAEKILAGLTTEIEMYQACLEAYEELDTFKEYTPVERVHENAKLLFLLRNIGEMWEPPI